MDVGTQVDRCSVLCRLINPQTMMLGQEPRQTTSNLGHLNKPSIQALIHGLNRHYYSISISYRWFLARLLSEADFRFIGWLPSVQLGWMHPNLMNLLPRPHSFLAFTSTLCKLPAWVCRQAKLRSKCIATQMVDLPLL